MLKPSSHQSKKRFLNEVHIIHMGRNIYIFFIYNVIYYNLLLNMFTLGKVFMKVDFQENEDMPVLHGALQLFLLLSCHNLQ